jgi:GNAT superfamily N-acetyltransferase
MDSGALSPTVFVRPASPADVPIILRFVRELAEYERALDQVVATEESLARNLFGQGFGRGPVAEALIGGIDGRPEGFALFFSNFSTWLATSGIYLEDLYVTPAARGRGLGKRLLIRLAQIAVERGCGRLEWSVLNWNEPAIRFYRALGATPLREWTMFRLSGDALRRAGSPS